MIYNNNNFFNSNPYDNIDNEIKFNFQKKYGLCLNKLNYNTFGIVDDCFLISLIGESSLFHVYLGYKYGKFFSVKVMKRNKYDSKEVLINRVNLFEKEVELRMKLHQHEINNKLSNIFGESNSEINAENNVSLINSTYIIPIHHVNWNKFIIYENYCVNGKLKFYTDNSISEKFIRTLFLNLIDFLRRMNESKRLFHTSINLDDLILDENFNFKILGIRDINYSVFSSNIYYNSFSTNNTDEIAQVNSLVVLLCKMLFKEDYERILPFLNNNLKVTNLKAQDDELKAILTGFKFTKKNKNNDIDIFENETSSDGNYFINNEENKEDNKSINTSKYEVSSDDISASKNDNEFIKLNKNACSTNSMNEVDKLLFFNNKDKGNSDNSNNIFSANMEFLDKVLVGLISKYTVLSSILDKDSLKEFIKKLIRDKTLEDIEFSSWYNGEILDSFEYHHEIYTFRNKALEKNFQELGIAEKNLISKKRGIFKVIK